MHSKKFISAIAAAAAVAFVTAPITSSLALAKHHHGLIHCYGVNSCKGKSACKSAKNACKGQNSCKGQGYVEVKSAKACKKMHGSTMEPKE